MKQRHTIQRPGLKRRFFGSKAYLRSVQRKVKNAMKPKKALSI